MAADRDAMGRFLPGNKQSPGGKKQTPEFKARARLYAEEALERLAAIMRDPNAKHADVIRACEDIIERAYGKAPLEEPMVDKQITVVLEAAGPSEWNE